MKRSTSIMLLLAAVLWSCSPPRGIPVPTQALGAATRAPTASPPPSIPTALPTLSPWLGWRASDENVALKKPVRVSHTAYGYSKAAAVDGNPRTQWSSGAGPTQWIEIDLQANYDIAEILLIPGLVMPGVTIHRVLGAPAALSEFHTLYVFDSQVSDSPLLAYAASAAWQNVRIVRIETTYSPASIGWREIEIFRAE